MSVHPTTHRTTLRGLVAAGTILLTSFGATGVASATSPSVTTVDGNPNCASIGAGYTELKIDPVPQGASSESGGSFTGRITVDGRVFDWTSTEGVDVVIVKGGPSANVYRYTPEAMSGTGLHAPVNPSNGLFYGLSHIDFCYDAGEETTPTPPAPEPEPEPCTEGGPTTMPNGTPCEQPEGPMPCEEGGPTTMPDGAPCEPEGPKPCAPGGATTMPNGEPCEPESPRYCEEGGATTKPNGEPCVEPEPKPEPKPEQGTSSTPPVTQTVTAEPQPFVAAEQNRAEPAASQVLGATGTIRRVAARARMQGPKRCVVRPFRQVLRGTGIKRVTMYVNGRKVRTMRGGRSTYTLRVDPRSARGGVVRITAKVQYVAASGKRTQTLRATALRCAQQAVLPRFAG